MRRCGFKPRATARRGKAQAGFTLLELVVAMVVLSLLVAVLASGAGLTGRVEARVERTRQEVGDLSTVLTQTRLRLAGAVALPEASSGNQARMAFAGEPERLRFVSARPEWEPGWPLTAVELALVPFEGGTRLTMRVAPVSPAEPDWRGLATARPRVLVEVPAAMSFAYLGPAGGGGAWRWGGEWRRRATLPEAVRLAADEAPELFPTLMVRTQSVILPQCGSESLDDPGACQ